MFHQFFKYHVATYQSDSRVCQAALTWQKAKYDRLQHLGDDSVCGTANGAMAFGFEWAREEGLRYAIFRRRCDTYQFR